MHSAVAGTLEGLSENSSKDEIIAAIYAVRGSLSCNGTAEHNATLADTSFDTVSTCTTAESSPASVEPKEQPSVGSSSVPEDVVVFGEEDPVTPTVSIENLDTPAPFTVEAVSEALTEACAAHDIESCSFMISRADSEQIGADESIHAPKFTEAEVDVIKRTVEAETRRQTQLELKTEFEVCVLSLWVTVGMAHNHRSAAGSAGS
jgi:hypothetical protein